MKNTNHNLNPVPAERFKSLLKEKNIKKQDLAKRIHVTPQTISKWVNGKANITVDNAQRIVEVLMDKPDRFSVDWLLGKSEFKTEQEYLDHAEDSKFLKKNRAAFMLDSLTSTIPMIVGFTPEGYRYEIIPLNDDGDPLTETIETEEMGKIVSLQRIRRCDVSDKSIKRYGLSVVDDNENHIGCSIIFNRSELIVFLVEIQEMIINKINFEIRYHNRRFEKENEYAEGK